MNSLQISALVDEVTIIKNANLQMLSRVGSRLARGAGDALHRGWHGFDRVTGSGSRTGWFGLKGITAGLTATQLPDALKAEDPSGQGRSRGERLARLAGNTAGGLAGAGAITKQFGPKGPGALKGLGRFAANTGVQLGIGTAGVLAGEGIAAAPFKLMKKKQPAQFAPNSMDVGTLAQPNQQPVYGNNIG